MTRFQRCHAAVAVSALVAVGMMTPAVLAGEKTVEVEWSGEYRARGETLTDYDLNGDSGDERTPILQRVRLGALVKPASRVDLFAQIQDSRAFGDEDSTASNEANVDLHQAWARLRPNDTLALTIGRQEWSYGDERLIGAFGWNNVGRAFDGVHARVSVGGGWFDLMWARLARLIDDGGDEVNRDLAGAYGHFDLTKDVAVEPYLLHYRSGDDLPSELEGRAGTSSVLAFGGRLQGKFGKCRLGAELVGETGDIGGDDLSAFAAGLTGAIKFGDADGWFEPRAGFDYASGDDNPVDGDRGEFFNFFPTNHKFYGYADLFGWRNLKSPWGGAAFGGHGHMVQVKFHRFWLAHKAGRWSSAGGATLGFDPSGMSGDDVGWELDINYTKQILEAVKLHAGYARFTPGDFAKATRGNDPANFAYFEAAVGF